MRPVKNPSLSKQTNTNTGTFSLAQFCSEFDKQRFDVGPVDIAAGWSGKYQFQCFLMLAFHSDIVPYIGTVSRVKY